MRSSRFLARILIGMVLVPGLGWAKLKYPLTAKTDRQIREVRCEVRDLSGVLLQKAILPLDGTILEFFEPQLTRGVIKDAAELVTYRSFDDYTGVTSYSLVLEFEARRHPHKADSERHGFSPTVAVTLRDEHASFLTDAALQLPTDATRVPEGPPLVNVGPCEITKIDVAKPDRQAALLDAIKKDYFRGLLCKDGHCEE